MDFQSAEREYRRLEEFRSTGHIPEQEYRDKLNALRVTDENGQLWMLQERTGQWFVYYGNQWMPATPPGRQPVVAPPSLSTWTQPGAVAPQEQRGGCGKVIGWVGIWAVMWVLIAVGLYLFAGAKEEPLMLLGVGAAALLSLILMLANLNSQWSGQVMDVRTERERVQRGDDDWGYENVTYAYVRYDSGKVKKMRAMPGWQVGDRLRKARGDSAVRKV